MLTELYDRYLVEQPGVWQWSPRQSVTGFYLLHRRELGLEIRRVKISATLPDFGKNLVYYVESRSAGVKHPRAPLRSKWAWLVVVGQNVERELFQLGLQGQISVLEIREVPNVKALIT